MGKNKRDGSYQTPVDHYRKQIGKQDYKKSKSNLKETKFRAQAKQSQSEVYKEICIMVGSLILVIGVIYALLYFYL